MSEQIQCIDDNIPRRSDITTQDYYFYQMNNFDPIVKNINRFIALNKSEIDLFTSQLKMVRIKRKQQIVQPDFVCKYRTYVVSGALKAYIIDPNDGQEHVIRSGY